MENRHHRRIRDKAIAEANVGIPPKRNWGRPVMITLAVGALALFVWFFASRVIPDPEKPETAGGSTARVLPEGELSISTVEKLAVDFMRAETIEELLALVEEPEVNEPRIRKFLEETKISLPFNGEIIRVVELEKFTPPVYELLINGVFGAESGLPVRAGEDGEAGINWEWAAGWMDPDWDTVMNEKSEEPVLMKAYCQLDDYYNYEYKDDEMWQSIRISDSFGLKRAYAYVARSNPALAVFEKAQFFRPMTITVKFAPGQTREIMEIVELNALGWVFDEEE